MNFFNTPLWQLRDPAWGGAAQLGLLLALWVSAALAWADDADAVLGLWAGPSSILEVYQPAPGVLAAKVVALKNPLFREGENGPLGKPVTDVNNPDQALRDQPMLGLHLLRDYQLKGKKWQGKIYDPKSGKLYSSSMRVAAGKLLLRGYIGSPMFGRTEKFVPVGQCTELIRRMLESASLPGCEAPP